MFFVVAVTVCWVVSTKIWQCGFQVSLDANAFCHKASVSRPTEVA